MGDVKDLYQELELGVLDRMMVAELLPAREDITALRLIRVFKEALSFSAEELELLNFQPAPGGKGLQWSNEGAKKVGRKTMSCPITIYLVLQATLKELNDSKQLTEDHVSLYERIVGV